ncbi:MULTISPECIES: hypothetical protein [Dactylosporangium]|uniref:Uncharacterized protein n=2 Tax=Dactylosporangium TaxID=35753 RepID=A0A9W6NTT9_9ACTN|nr:MULTISPECIES: hypothetical protein [Dactylosporangium]UAB96209.1 hypothetical protein Dvina_51145 [Dactylosporangium vinaceum]UWZ44569.1 hypothetical protein Dmats_45730 [Dactylosporangium matsuzakiense]GLL08577.1 hypothetical protein GCM10017581_103440 [Dactylosporangium matsuzakiense]
MNDDRAAWRAIADALTPAAPGPDPQHLVRAVLTRSALAEPLVRGRRRRLRHLAALLVAEARLIRFPVPVASALVMALGVATVLLQRANGVGADMVLALVAPIVAAAGIAGTYRSRLDPAAELVAATPTSGRRLLLVRIALVFGYNLVLALGASAALDGLVGAWLGPMVLLSSLSLLLAVRFGPDVALGAVVGLWVVRVMAGGVLAADGRPARYIVAAWSTNAAVLAIGAGLAVVAVIVAGRGEPRDGWRATNPM